MLFKIFKGYSQHALFVIIVLKFEVPIRPLRIFARLAIFNLTSSSKHFLFFVTDVDVSKVQLLQFRVNVELNIWLLLL